MSTVFEHLSIIFSIFLLAVMLNFVLKRVYVVEMSFTWFVQLFLISLQAVIL